MPLPIVTLSARGADRVKSGHPWVYRSDVRKSSAQPGDLVRVESERGRPLGTALWSSTSQISLRFLGPDDVSDEREMFRDRLRAALAFRDTLAIDATAWRAVNAEADRLPGLIVDVYGDPSTPGESGGRSGQGPSTSSGQGPSTSSGQGPSTSSGQGGRVVVVQTLTQGMDRRLALITDVLVELLAPVGVLARNDPKVRRLEGLAEETVVTFGEVPDIVDVREGPVRYAVDVRLGQKTGLFLDQRENHEAAMRYARGRGLDAFSYHGGFALRLAARCDAVVALDSSAPAIAQLKANAARNGLANIEARETNVFDELREFEIARQRFDTIVLDPPAFAKNKASVERAAAGYKEINLRALKLLTPNGCLITCSCSSNIDEVMFQDILEHAAADARVTVALVEKRSQARDHPVLLAAPETHYLKCLVLRKLA